jgi:excisionase family DNA binding protein
MSIILFIIGTIMAYTGRFAFGGFRAEGKAVRAGGLILMSPATLTFIAALMGGMVFAGNMQALQGFLSLIAMLEFFGLMVATGLAYVLVADPAGAPRLPGILGDIQAEREQKVNPIEEVRKAQPQQIQASETHAAHPLNRQIQAATHVESFGKILNIKQAANFLNLPEPAIVGMIHEGQLPAVRSGGDYAIARSRLEEIKSTGRVDLGS